jgi:hypothetical protein
VTFVAYLPAFCPIVAHSERVATRRFAGGLVGHARAIAHWVTVAVVTDPNAARLGRMPHRAHLSPLGICLHDHYQFVEKRFLFETF